MSSQVQIEEEIIKVSTLTIGGRRMTKAVFNQIISSFPFNRQLQFVAEKHVGFVNDGKEHWLVYISKGEIRKCSLHALTGFSRVTRSTDFFLLNKFAHALYITLPEEISDSAFSSERFEKEDWQSIESLVNQAKATLSHVADRQIFIAA